TRPQRRFTRKARIHEQRSLRPEVEAVSRGGLHQEVMRMLPVDEGIAAVGRLTGLKEQRITARAHEGIGRCHDVYPEGRMLALASGSEGCAAAAGASAASAHTTVAARTRIRRCYAKADAAGAPLEFLRAAPRPW